jgi:hypothetical protein
MTPARILITGASGFGCPYVRSACEREVPDAEIIGDGADITDRAAIVAMVKDVARTNPGRALDSAEVSCLSFRGRAERNKARHFDFSSNWLARATNTSWLPGAGAQRVPGACLITQL